MVAASASPLLSFGASASGAISLRRNDSSTSVWSCSPNTPPAATAANDTMITATTTLAGEDLFPCSTARSFAFIATAISPLVQSLTTAPHTVIPARRESRARLS